jgi:hypothetical protein
MWSKPMLRWEADAALNELIARYYGGEAGLWDAIRASVDAELRRRNLPSAARHIRLRRLAAGAYEVIVEEAERWRNE